MKTQLIEIENKQFSYEARESMVRQLEYYMAEINKISPKLKLSRSQHSPTENRLFLNLARELNYLIIGNGSGVLVSSSFLNSTTTVLEDSVDIKELTEFLTEEIQILRKIKEINYLKLREFQKGFAVRINERFI